MVFFRPGWPRLEPDRAADHPLYGTGGLLRVVWIGCLYCAGISALRVLLRGAGLVDGGRLDSLAGPALTLAPVADLAFALLFVRLLRQLPRRGATSFPANALITCGLYGLYAVIYAMAARDAFGGALDAMSPQILLHYYLPALFCLWTAIYVSVSRRVMVTYHGKIPPQDPFAGNSFSGARQGS
ncbi:MAG: hypothetical protein ACTS3R_06305 [Inquilinaceae bacterium]